ncbi:MAG: DDE transposase family protein [Leptolyngbya sp. RL_3_1]|nr:DDE transposase family protein [Leptolyngbya sp. RL_3_1]
MVTSAGSGSESASPETWFVVKTATGVCEILPSLSEAPGEESPHWGPYASRGEAIVRRIGLIRAGKCRPV